MQLVEAQVNSQRVAETQRKAAAAEFIREAAEAADKEEKRVAAEMEELRVSRLLIEHNTEKTRVFQLQRYCDQRWLKRQWELFCNVTSVRRYMIHLECYYQCCMRQMQFNYVAQLNKMRLVQAQVHKQEVVAEEKERRLCYANAGCDRTIKMLDNFFCMRQLQLCCPFKCASKVWIKKCLDCQKISDCCEIIKSEDEAEGERLAAENREQLAICVRRKLTPVNKKVVEVVEVVELTPVKENMVSLNSLRGPML
jgi:hypothetical protein